MGVDLKAFWILILILFLGVSGIWLWGFYGRLKKALSQKSQELDAFRASLEDFRAAVQKQASDSLEKQLSVFRTTELKAGIELAREQAALEFRQWKEKTIQTERADAIKQSRAVNRGLVAEQLAPHMAGFAYNPKDCHFLGKPVDYVVFSGLDAGKLDRIVLLEVKTGDSQMNARERQVRDAVLAGRVSYEIFKLEGE